MHKRQHLRRHAATTAIALAAVVSLSACQSPGETREDTAVGEAPDRLFLQQVTHTGAIVKWRGSARELCLIDNWGGTNCRLGEVTDGYHRQVRLTGLTPDTTYRYQVGQYRDRDYRFTTAPPPGELGEDGSINLWLLGDSGTASELDQHGNYSHAGDARAVMDGYRHFVDLYPARAADMILLLGDNAYLEGTDQQWQQAVFDLYNPMLYQAALWPTIGNHEMGSQTHEYQGRTVTYPGTSTSADPHSFVTVDERTPRTMPYLDIFTLPTGGEAGGVASGTEQYYAFNYGNLHVVSLDSQLSARDPAQRQAMKEWLVADLQANTADWTVVIFHHPPYSKSSHDSDTAAVAQLRGIDDPMVDMREEFTALFEDYGVDMVYSGHSHAYERSYYLNGHRGDSDTFDAARHAETGADGKPVTGRPGTPFYQISRASGVDDKVVYTVAGSAGKVDEGDNGLNHPAHVVQPADKQQRRGLAELGSVHMEITKTSLTARFIDTAGNVLDQAEIRR